MLGFGPHFNAPIIAFSPTVASKATTDMVGTPSPLSYVPHIMLPFTEEMTFPQRFLNTLINFFEWIFFDFMYMPGQMRIYEDAFQNPEKPSLNDVRRNVSLVLLNSHFTLNYPRPYMVNMIDIGGIHLSPESNYLPKEIQYFLDTATHGAIYFAMGSNIQSSSMPLSKKNDILKVFAGLKQKVLWKWEEQHLIGKSENVLIRKWFSQEDILAHPKVKVFICHGGLLSITEAIYHGIPIIGIPVFGDQSMNMAKASREGYGLTINYENLTESSLQWAISEILNNDKYILLLLFDDMNCYYFFVLTGTEYKLNLFRSDIEIN